jgi:hypothetical protein
MTPDPAPRPGVVIGCFMLVILVLFSVVILGASLNDFEVIIALSILFVVLILALVRILFRKRDDLPPTPPP